MFKVNDSIVYPIYGCGKIKKETEEKIDNQVVKYFELEFPETKIEISIPVEQAANLGLREPLKKEELTEMLKNLWKKVKITKEQVEGLETISRDLLNSGSIEDAITLVNLIKSLERNKSTNNKSLSFSDEQSLESAINFIRSEVLCVLGEEAASELKLLEE